MYTIQRDARTRTVNHKKHNPTQRCAVTQQPQRSAAQRRTRDITKPQSQYCGTAPYSLRSRQRRPCMSKTRIVHRAYDAATMLHTSQVQRAPPRPCRLAPRSPTPSHHKHARTDTRDATNPTRHNGTAASWRVSPRTTHAHNPRNAHRKLTCRIQTHKPARPHDVPHSTNHCALRSYHRMCTPLHARHAQHGTQLPDRPPHTPPTPRRPQKITPSHTRGLHATLTIVESGCPASTGCCRTVGCCTTSSPCRTHEQPSRRIMAPDAHPTPASRPQRIAAHRTTLIKSSQMKASQYTACYRSRTTPCASDPNNDTTRQPTGT